VQDDPPAEWQELLLSDKGAWLSASVPNNRGLPTSCRRDASSWPTTAQYRPASSPLGSR